MNFNDRIAQHKIDHRVAPCFLKHGLVGAFESPEYTVVIALAPLCRQVYGHSHLWCER